MMPMISSRNKPCHLWQTQPATNTYNRYIIYIISLYVHTFGFVSTKHHIRRGIHLLEPLKPKLQGPMRWHQMDRKTVPLMKIRPINSHVEPKKI